MRQRFSVSLAPILCFPPRSIKHPRDPVQSNRGRIISGKTGVGTEERGAGSVSLLGYMFHIEAIKRTLSTIRIFWAKRIFIEFHSTVYLIVTL